MYSLPQELKIPEKVVNFNVFPLEKKEKMIEQSLRLISQGKMCTVIDATCPLQLMEEKEPVSTKKFDLGLPLKFTILEFFLKRLKDLGNLAVEKFGRNFQGKREPILVIICVSEGDVDEVDEVLERENYYGYEGVLCFCTVRMEIMFNFLIEKFQILNFPLILKKRTFPHIWI